MSGRNRKHDHYLFVRKEDYGLWDSFKARHPKTSIAILNLIRLYMAGRLYLDDGRQVKL